MEIANSCAYECGRAWHIEAPTINSGGFKQESTNSPNRRQTADVRIFIMEDKAQWSYFSKNYRGAVRCIKCSTMHDRVQLSARKFPASQARAERPTNPHANKSEPSFLVMQILRR